MGNRFGITAVTAFALTLFMAACATGDVERAFDPKTAEKDSNKIIISYCMSCHTHRTFDAAAHVPAAQERHAGTARARATECRACHTYSVTWMGDEVRGTHWPAAKEP
ncbi:MAG: hypothetical protein HZA03_11300 [Nitrospinae bacterium]|nr:hypothetical protein [Nitrospinota bacterium]